MRARASRASVVHSVAVNDAIAGTVKEAVTNVKSWNENRKRRAARLSNKQAKLASKEGARTRKSEHAPTRVTTHARSHTGAREQERSSALPSAATARDSFALGAAEAQSASAVFDGDGKGGSGRAQNPQNSNERTTRLADRLQPGGVPDQPRPIAAQPRKGGCAPREASVASSADEADAAGASVRARRPCARSRTCGRASCVRECACVQGSASSL